MHDYLSSDVLPVLASIEYQEISYLMSWISNISRNAPSSAFYLQVIPCGFLLWKIVVTLVANLIYDNLLSMLLHDLCLLLPSIHITGSYYVVASSINRWNQRQLRYMVNRRWYEWKSGERIGQMSLSITHCSLKLKTEGTIHQSNPTYFASNEQIWSTYSCI